MLQEADSNTRKFLKHINSHDNKQNSNIKWFCDGNLHQQIIVFTFCIDLDFNTPRDCHYDKEIRKLT